MSNIHNIPSSKVNLLKLFHKEYLKPKVDSSLTTILITQPTKKKYQLEYLNTEESYDSRLKPLNTVVPKSHIKGKSEAYIKIFKKVNTYVFDKNLSISQAPLTKQKTKVSDFIASQVGYLQNLKTGESYINKYLELKKQQQIREHQ